MEDASVARRPAPLRLGLRALLLLRLAAPVLYLAALAGTVWEDGIPAARDRLLAWIVVGLLAFSITNPRGWLRSVVLEWLPFALVLWAYDLLRGQADGLLFDYHVTPQLEADRLLGLGTVPTVWLQEHLWRGGLELHWWDYASWGVYTSYFLATYLLAGWLWAFARERFRRYVATVSLLALMGFATYTLFPAAPPWLASEEGALEPTTRLLGIVSGHVPVIDFAGLFERGSAYANPVAAVPSLHAAYTLLFTLVLWRQAPRWLRPVLAAYPLAMAFALAYTAEHYLVDVLLGWLYCALAIVAVERVAARLDARRRRPAGP